MRWERFVNRQLIRGATTLPDPFDDLPLDTEDAIIGLQLGDEEFALRDLGGIPSDPEAAHERTQDRFARRVKRLAAALTAGALTLYLWHRLMRDEVKNHVLQQALLGGSGSLSDPKRVDGEIRRETDYLSRFADQIAREGTTGRTGQRSVLYGGSGRAAFYRERESTLPQGYVVNYKALDDTETCNPCHSAEIAGPYLPDQGPFPGVVCLGRANCRCRRVPRYDPPLAAFLRSRQ